MRGTVSSYHAIFILIERDRLLLQTECHSSIV